MSIVIVGGNDRMVCQYMNICKKHKCKAKVFTQMKIDLKSRIGNPDLIILFTNTVSHKMIHTALQGAQKTEAIIERCHSSSATALENILEKYTACPA